MITKTYVAKYSNADERAKARQRFHNRNYNFQVGNIQDMSVVFYKNEELETTVTDDSDNNLGIIICAKEESLDELVKALESKVNFGSKFEEQKD